MFVCCVPSRMCPIFQISNVTGENMDLLKMFLNLLSSRTSYRDDQPAEFQIDDTYSVPVLWPVTLLQLLSLNAFYCANYISEEHHAMSTNFRYIEQYL